MVTQTADDVAISTADGRRVARYDAQAFLWRTSVRPRGRSCGLRATGGSVELRRTESSCGATGGFAGLQTCGSVWACPVCSAKVLAKRQTEVERAVDGRSGRVAFLTFTVRHSADHTLAQVWDAVQAGHHGITAGRAHQGEKARYGLATTRVVASGRRKGQEVPCDVLPWLRVVEVTHGGAGWHVHQHMLVFLPADMSEDALQDLYGAMHARWVAGATDAGLDGSLMVNVAKFVDSASAIGTYVTKNTYSPAARAGLEVARGDLKSARFGNRSAMQLLRDLVDGATPGDRALWAEFERVSAGRRQMTWAGGARLLLGLGAERSDEDIASDALGTSDDAVCLIDPAVFRRQIAMVGRRVPLLRAVEMGADAALALLDLWGVPYTLPSITERRVNVLYPFAHLAAADAAFVGEQRSWEKFFAAARADLRQPVA